MFGRSTDHGGRAGDGVAGALGRGLVAGLVGTVAMTASSTLEARLRGRGPSGTPAEVAEDLLDVDTEGPAARSRLNHVVHWTYGTALGTVRGALAAIGVREPAATPATFGLVWAGELVTLPALGVAPPVWEWSAREIAIDALHHAVYAAGAGVTYEALDRLAA